ncbi:MAG: FUSC family protein [Firmicutes bacterium]|nr:FUSC family protein [Bacillota bacterium]
MEGVSMYRSTRLKIMRGVSRLDVWMGIRLTLVALLSMLLGRLLGLHAFYWAGISAIVVSTGTPGGSFAAIRARVSGTLVGLIVGFGAVALAGHTLLAASLAVPLSILLCQALGLKNAMKLAALSTLFPVSAVMDSHGLDATFTLALARTENVLLGCAVTLLIDGFLWPERTSTKLQGLLAKDLARASRLAAALVEAYVERGVFGGEALLADLQRARMDYPELLRDVNDDAEEAALSRRHLRRQAEEIHRLVDHCAALRDIQRQAAEDRVHGLLQAELTALAHALREAGRALEESPDIFEARVENLQQTGQHLEAAYEGLREARATQAFPSQEAFRLLGVLYLCGAMIRSFGQLVQDPEAQEA